MPTLGREEGLCLPILSHIEAISSHPIQFLFDTWLRPTDKTPSPCAANVCHVPLSMPQVCERKTASVIEGSSTVTLLTQVCIDLHSRSISFPI